jgi:hypothetical protein
MNPLAVKIAKSLRQMMTPKPLPNNPKGLPDFGENQDNNLDGNYKQENLMDPGIRNMVTGSGRGPVIGGYNRGVSRVGQGGC